ncbi:acyl-CoA dehydrogenase family protein (plasmid) [Streptomyces sp. NBC_01340]|uniref:acyl-CoA dehydrogenase family protein n=1 Tax=unclassified Streptomyces TaxID=2593676 RepID=UPI00224F8A5A|nr:MULTISPECIES: acyl-CoA dehydrogenase family protein [unclassified Streptomyces]MCX4462288.1 acyl-CoA dehydrogenase family protein [Streptomyces sp. NBC_01719]MCX4500726.1 acyl-CoA dehydrogenase family protein [Streptomyces sp. NBC_01728]MCX4598685.1 acyl-CoA dehydrogenase family protein [Streptomyces sp. NBC_01549]WSI35936.1 acyl-CoA dehydrogenase family protein [Streptomyces sp. NBC_01340]WSI43876.1 acyl-CoA dehydrogenase family protein [Streptomyces sp. NBC_01340]
MTTTATPLAPQDDQLAADFYLYEALLSDEERKILLKARTFLREEVKPLVNEYWSKGEFPKELIEKFRGSGLAALSYEGYGEHLPAISHLLDGMLAMEMSRVDASCATFFGVHNGLGFYSIYYGGDQEQRDRWLPAMASMEKIGAFALTEPLGGSDVSGGMRTTARREGDTWVLNGAKKWIGNATFADYVVVWARDVDDNQVKGFVVEKGAPGFEPVKIEGKIALRIVENAEITLTDVRVAEANRLQKINSFRDVAEILRFTRSGVAWQALGVMIGAYELALDYAKERRQFGRPIAKFQIVQDLLVKSLGNITASWGMLVQLARLQDQGIFRDEHSSLAKAFVTSRMREVVAFSREIFGGNGILLDYDVARFFADAEALYSYEGTREMQTLIVGKSITGHSAFV